MSESENSVSVRRLEEQSGFADKGSAENCDASGASISKEDPRAVKFLQAYFDGTR